MSKSSQPPDYHPDLSPDAAPPPSYAASIASPPANLPAAAASSPSLFSSPLSAHVHSLPGRLRANQLIRSSRQAAQDLDLITLIAPRLEAFFEDIASAPRTPPVAEATLVPAAAVPAGWALTGAAERRREGEFVRVIRVAGKFDIDSSGKNDADRKRYSGFDDDDDDGGDGHASTSAAAEAGFDEWGRFDTGPDVGTSDDRPGPNWWWFRDEEMARRLAGHLKPQPNLERKEVRVALAEKKDESGGGKKSPGLGGGGGGWKWGFKRKDSGGLSSPTAARAMAQTVTSPGAFVAVQEDAVKMTVRVEEVAFRRENDFGIWEGRSGFGIVITVRSTKV